MRRTAMYLALLATMAVATLVLAASPAGAQITSCTTHTASPAAVSAGTISAGDQLTVTGGGFAPNQALQIGLAQPPVVLATVASNANGDYQTTITTPVTTPSGQNEIIVFGPGPTLGSCHQSIALFSVIARPVPVPVPPPVQIIQPPVIHQPVIVTQPAPVAVPAPIVKAPLARTGSPTMTLGIGGAASLLAGAVLVAFSRPTRRRSAASA